MGGGGEFFKFYVLHLPVVFQKFKEGGGGFILFGRFFINNIQLRYITYLIFEWFFSDIIHECP